MKRIMERVSTIVGVTGALLSVLETTANALGGNNHCEPVAHDRFH